MALAAHSLIVALTGGIASGKTTLANAFAALGVKIFDADVIARGLVAPGQPLLQEIVAVFGANAVNSRGELDRRRMRELVFVDADAKRKLEQILHPRVRSELFALAHECAAPYCLLAIPLFAESAYAYAWVDRVLVVDIPTKIQLARLMSRDGMTIDFANRALAAQANRDERLALADDVIDNAGDPGDLPNPAARLHQLYLAAAHSRRDD